MDNKPGFSLTDIKNYNNELNKGELILYLKTYNLIIEDFLKKSFESINYETSEHFYQILIRGVNSLEHIFNLLFLYTKNINLTLYYTNKASHGYIGYTNRLIISNADKMLSPNTNNVISLIREIKNTKNAMLCVYDESIKKIDEEYKKKYVVKKDEIIYFDVIKTWSKFANLIFLSGINMDYKKIDKKDITSKINEIKKNNEKYIDGLLTAILTLDESSINNKLKSRGFIVKFKNQIELIFKFMIFLNKNNIDYKECNSILKLFVNQINTKMMNLINLESRLIDSDLKSNTNKKFIKGLFV